ncbi:MAG: hypothetical protein OXR73_16670 [Myxococcales bacterium]|nr:hypothetical protein [Myxococcales bacterium]
MAFRTDGDGGTRTARDLLEEAFGQDEVSRRILDGASDAQLDEVAEQLKRIRDQWPDQDVKLTHVGVRAEDDSHEIVFQTADGQTQSYHAKFHAGGDLSTTTETGTEFAAEGGASVTQDGVDIKGTFKLHEVKETESRIAHDGQTLEQVTTTGVASGSAEVKLDLDDHKVALGGAVEGPTIGLRVTDKSAPVDTEAGATTRDQVAVEARGGIGIAGGIEVDERGLDVDRPRIGPSLSGEFEMKRTVEHADGRVTERELSLSANSNIKGEQSLGLEAKRVETDGQGDRTEVSMKLGGKEGNDDLTTGLGYKSKDVEFETGLKDGSDGTAGQFKVPIDPNAAVPTRQQAHPQSPERSDPRPGGGGEPGPSSTEGDGTRSPEADSERTPLERRDVASVTDTRARAEIMVDEINASAERAETNHERSAEAAGDAASAAEQSTQNARAGQDAATEAAEGSASAGTARDTAESASGQAEQSEHAAGDAGARAHEQTSRAGGAAEQAETDAGRAASAAGQADTQGSEAEASASEADSDRQLAGDHAAEAAAEQQQTQQFKAEIEHLKERTEALRAESEAMRAQTEAARAEAEQERRSTEEIREATAQLLAEMQRLKDEADTEAQETARLRAEIETVTEAIAQLRARGEEDRDTARAYLDEVRGYSDRSGSEASGAETAASMAESYC